jgi:hypothetical protein
MTALRAWFAQSDKWMCILTGPPGSGKTWALRYLEAELKMSTRICPAHQFAGSAAMLDSIAQFCRLKHLEGFHPDVLAIDHANVVDSPYRTGEDDGRAAGAAVIQQLSVWTEMRRSQGKRMKKVCIIMWDDESQPEWTKSLRKCMWCQSVRFYRPFPEVAARAAMIRWRELGIARPDLGPGLAQQLASGCGCDLRRVRAMAELVARAEPRCALREFGNSVVNLFFMSSTVLRGSPPPASDVLAFAKEENNRCVEFVCRNAADKVAKHASVIDKPWNTMYMLAEALSDSEGATPLSSAMFAAAAGFAVTPVNGVGIQETKYPSMCGKTARSMRDHGLAAAIEHAAMVNKPLFGDGEWFRHAPLIVGGRPREAARIRFAGQDPHRAAMVRAARFPASASQEECEELEHRSVEAFQRIESIQQALQSPTKWT